MTGKQPVVPVLFEDEHLLVVSKPAGILVVPAPGRSAATLVDVLQRSRGERLHPVHRLDEETTGVMVVARTLPAKAALEGLFARHDLERVYVALVERMPSPAAGRLESQLSEDERGIMRSVQRGGERAITHYRALCRRGRYVLVECRLETGRRNQIRVHLSELGCPVAGDRKYGFRGGPGDRFPRVMLHARKLAFRHPMTGAELLFEVSAPESELALPSDVP